MPFARGHREGHVRRWLATALAACSLGLLGACDDNGDKTAASSDQRRAEAAPPRTAPDAPQPPRAAPGAAPSAQRLIGTWTVTATEGGSPDRSDRSETTTYRFEEGGRVTVAGSKQCAYAFEELELKVDCQGRMTAGKVEFRGDQTMLWAVGGGQIVTLTKR